MKVEYINPFIESVHELFSTMFECEATRGDVGVCREVPPSRDIVAIITLSGPARGIVALSFPVKTALAMVGRMLGTEMHIIDDAVWDGLAELVNIVAGGAKAKFVRGEGRPIQLSLPTVVRGHSYAVDHPSNSAWLEVPFESDLGPFSLRVTFEPDGEDGSGSE